MQRRTFDFGPEDERSSTPIRLIRRARRAAARAWHVPGVRMTAIAAAALTVMVLLGSGTVWLLTGSSGSHADGPQDGKETEATGELAVRAIDNRSDLINRYIAYTEDPRHTLFVGVRSSRQLATTTIDISQQRVGAGRYRLHPYRTEAGTLYLGNRTDVVIPDNSMRTTPQGTVLAYVIDKRERTNRHLLYHIDPAARSISLVYEQPLLGELQKEVYERFHYSEDGSRVAFHGVTSDRTVHLKLLDIAAGSLLGAYTGDELGLFRSALEVEPMRFINGGRELMFRLETSSERQLSPIYVLSIASGDVVTVTDDNIVRRDNWIYHEPTQQLLVAHPGPEAVPQCTGYTDRERVNNVLTLLSLEPATSTQVYRATSTNYLTDFSWQQGVRAASLREGSAVVTTLGAQLGTEPFTCWQTLSTSTKQRIIELPTL
jgi:hypothetical protein